MVAIRTGVAPVEDKEVFVGGTQHAGFLDEVVVELIGNPGQVDIVDVDEVESVGPPAARLAGHLVTKAGARERTGVLFGALLVVVADIDLERVGELQSGVGACLDGSSAVLAPLVTAACIEREQFRATEEVLVHIPYSYGYSPISGGIGALYLGRYRVDLAA